jgi:hypothetical protein
VPIGLALALFLGDIAARMGAWPRGWRVGAGRGA